MIMLKVTDLKVNYGGIEALKGISFDVRQGQIVSLIGANGAGKSTTLRAISGLVKPRSGSITFRGEDITGKDGNEMLCYFSLGNFISAQQGAPQLLGGMASLVFEKDENGCRIREAELVPTVTWIYRAPSSSGLDFRALLLTDYTDDMAERHTQGFTPEDFWELFEPFA